MLKKTMGMASEELQSILDEVGVDSFPKAKALYLKDVMIVDEEGAAIDPEDLDVEVKFKDAIQGYDEEEEEVALELKAEEEEEEEADATAPRPKPATSSAPKGGAGQPAKKRDRFGNVIRSADIEQIVSKTVKDQLSGSVRVKAHDMRVDAHRETRPIWGAMKHFSRIDMPNKEETAYRFGRWAAACMGHRKSVDWCNNNGIQTKAHLETVNSAGGFLVPDEFSNSLITLREEYGVFRRNASIEPMSSDTKRIPKRSATLSANFVGEAVAGTETTQTFQQVNLVAKKLMVLTTISNELNEDAMINLGDSVAGEIAYAFALKEDECGFLGDGTSTYGGIVGAIEAINAVSSNLSIETCTGGDTTAATVILDDIHDLLGGLPMYADTPNCKFYMHKSFFSACFERLVYDSGGVTAREISQGALGTTLFGYPVEFTPVMVTGSAADGAGATNKLKYPVLFGDLGMACAMGDRRSNTITFSDSALNAFEQDEIVVRGTERFDIQVHAPGTAAEAGPLRALKLAAS